MQVNNTPRGANRLIAFAPRWHRILNECLRIRLATPGPSLYPNPLTRRREALTFVSMAIDAAHRLP